MMPLDCGDWKPYFAWLPVQVDAYDVIEIRNGKMRFPVMGWVERRFCVWIDDDDDRTEHRVWRYRLKR